MNRDHHYHHHLYHHHHHHHHQTGVKVEMDFVWTDSWKPTMAPIFALALPPMVYPLVVCSPNMVLRKSKLI
jgi:hypothetical protein